MPGSFGADVKRQVPHGVFEIDEAAMLLVNVNKCGEIQLFRTSHILALLF